MERPGGEEECFWVTQPVATFLVGMAAPGPGPPRHPPDVPPRHRLIQRGCACLPARSPDPGGNPKEFNGGESRRKALGLRCQMTTAHRTVTNYWLAGWGAFSWTASVGPNEPQKMHSELKVTSDSGPEVSRCYWRGGHLEEWPLSLSAGGGAT